MSADRDPRPIKDRGWRALRAITPAVALALLAFAYFLGIRTERSGFVREVITPVMQKVTIPVLNAFRGGVPEVPRITLMVRNTVLDSLVLLEQELRAGRTEGAGTVFVGEVRWRDSLMTAALRLMEGPRSTAIPFSQPPLTLQLAATDTLLGMQRFDLVPVRNDAPLRAKLLELALRDQGLPVLGQRLVDVSVPGAWSGSYNMEALVDSLAWKRWGAPPAPIVRYGDDLLEGALAEPETTYPSTPPLQADWMAAPIITTVPGHDGPDDPLQRHAIVALEQFRAGRSAASTVFDVATLARLFALCDLLGGQSTIDWPNLRFFPDTTGKLLPLPRTLSAGLPIQAICALKGATPLRFPGTGHGFAERLFADPVFYHRYMAELASLSDAGTLDTILARIGPALSAQERMLSGYLPGAGLDRHVFAHNLQVVRATLVPKHLVLAYMEDRPGAVERLAIANVHSLPVEVLAAVVGQDTVAIATGGPFWPRDAGKPLAYRMVAINVPTPDSGNLRLLVRIVGTDRRVEVKVRTWSTFPADG